MDVRRVRDSRTIIIDTFQYHILRESFSAMPITQDKNANIHIIYTTATYFDELMGESFSLCFLRMTEVSHVSILMFNINIDRYLTL